jgi:hypothetical protein
MTFINVSIYWHVTGRISNSLNRLLHEFLGCEDLSDRDFALRIAFGKQKKKTNYLSDRKARIQLDSKRRTLLRGVSK